VGTRGTANHPTEMVCVCHRNAITLGHFPRKWGGGQKKDNKRLVDKRKKGQARFNNPAETEGLLWKGEKEP